MNSQWDRMASILERAGALSGGERARFLDEECGTDRELRSEVESLLAHDDDTDDYLMPPHVQAVRVAAPLVEGQILGGFRLVRRLGSGGMGSVYEAEQAHPHRRIALKVLPALEHNAAVQRRFAQEGELLARMNHPAIAQIFETGVDGATPYFAMELVEDALTITEYTRRHALTVAQSIELIRHVCAAIAHGHAKGVVHRDIKPGNVLVDAHGTVKVIDFGIARALDVAEGEGARMTRTGDLVGTLQYTSPEQAEGRIGDVDAQTDVHALGLVLYEMICGRRAYAIEGKPLTQALRAISQDAIPRVRSLRSDLPPEVEWILAKALEKDRARRYASVHELDADLERFLAHQPVLAGPPSRIYEARKFVRRHRVGVAALAAVFAALTIGLVVALSARNRAREARDQLAVRAHELEIETARKDRVLAFQNRLLTAASHDAQGYDVRVVELLDIAREELRTTHEEPEVALELHRALGEAYANLGRLEDALEESRATLELARSSTGISIERLAGFERIVVHLRCKLGADPAAAADEARSLLERNLARLGPSAPETLRSARVLTEHLARAGSFEEAESVARDALAQCVSRDSEEAAALIQSLTENFMQAGRFAEAEGLLRELFEIRRGRAGATDRRTLDAQTMLINCLALRGSGEEAEQLARTAVEAYVQRSGPEHVDTLSAQLVHCQTLLQLGREQEAVQTLKDVASRSKPLSRGDSIGTIDVRSRLGWMLDQCGQTTEALPILREAYAERVDRGLVEAETVQAATLLAVALRRAGLLAESEATAREAASQGEKQYGRSARVVVNAYQTLSITLIDLKRAPEAVETMEANVEIQRRLQGPEHDDRLRGLNVLALALSAAGRRLEAELVIREALAARVEKFGAVNAGTLRSREILAGLLNDAGRLQEAEAEFCEMSSAWRQVESFPLKVAEGCAALAVLRQALGRELDALDAYREAHAAASTLPPDSPERLDFTLRLAEQWLRVGQPDPVPGLLEPILEACVLAGGTGGPRARSCRELLLSSYEALGLDLPAAALREQIAAQSKGS